MTETTVTENSTTTSTDTESSTQTETVVSSTDIRPEFKEAMDSYEAFFDKYCEFMKNIMNLTIQHHCLPTIQVTWSSIQILCRR